MGLALGTGLVGWFGFSRVLRATASVGILGFLAVCGWQLVLFGVLGLCWYVLLPADRIWRLRVPILGRMVRDAAGQCLPFSLVGGFVFGARAVTLEGVSWPDATASTVVDLAAEFFAQIGLVLIGVFILAIRVPGASIMRPICGGLVAASAVCGAFVWLQRGGSGPLIAMSRRMLGGWRGAEPQLGAIQARLASIYAAPWRVCLCTALHLLGWFGTGVASWIAFRLLGADIDFVAALGIEALLHNLSKH